MAKKKPLIPEGKDGRAFNGGKRKGAGRKRKYPKGKGPVQKTVTLLPAIFAACKKRHGNLAKALAYAAFNGGKD